MIGKWTLRCNIYVFFPRQTFITPDELRRQSFALGSVIHKSGFEPTFLVALWRGGAAIGCYVHEFLKVYKPELRHCFTSSIIVCLYTTWLHNLNLDFIQYKGVSTDHIAIRTSRFTGIGIASEEVLVHNLTYLKERVKAGDSILLVDDVWDTGTSIAAFIKKINTDCGNLNLDIRVATVFYKPKRNKIGTFSADPRFSTIFLQCVFWLAMRSDLWTPLFLGRAPEFFVKESDEWLVFPHELEGMSNLSYLIP